jgi:uncharacterized damage-inducible protein DinB
VDGLLWHVMIHEMRHTAQIAVLLRTQGIEPLGLTCCITAIDLTMAHRLSVSLLFLFCR